VLVTIEMLGDWMARAGATAIWPAVAGAMAWVLLRKFGGSPYILIKVARSLADWRLPGREGRPGCVGEMRRPDGPVRGLSVLPDTGGSTPFLTEVRPHQSSGELDYRVHITDLNLLPRAPAAKVRNPAAARAASPPARS